jgi:hypothetical protein
MTPSEKPTTAREQILSEAISLTTKERNVQYGDPTSDFKRIASMWSTLFGYPFEPHEVAMAMICVKLSRASWDAKKSDHWIDIAGYAGCGYECVPGHPIKSDDEMNLILVDEKDNPIPCVCLSEHEHENSITAWNCDYNNNFGVANDSTLNSENDLLM